MVEPTSGALIDLVKGRRLLVMPTQQTPMEIGLNDKNDCCIVSATCPAKKLFTIKVLLDGGGHWLMPEEDVPCLMNGDPISGPHMLTHGDTIKTGPNTFKYNIGSKKTGRRKLPPTPGVYVSATPPPKPLRAVKQDQVEEKVDVTNQNAGRLTMPLEDQLLLHIDTPEQIASLSSSYLTKQVTCNTDTMLSPQDMDNIYKMMAEIAESNGKILFDFVREYHLQEKRLAENTTSNHLPVIWVLTELLRISLEPVEHNIMWLRLLNTFSHFTLNIPTFIKYRAHGVVMGAMAAHSHYRDVQLYSCSILAQIASQRLKLGEKIPLRESCVDLVLRCIQNYPQDVEVLRPACRTLANIASVVSLMIYQSLDKVKLAKDSNDSASELIEKLDYIYTNCQTVLEKVAASHLNDVGIQNECQRLFSYLNSKPDNG